MLVPDFDFSGAGGVGLALSRGAAVATLLSSFGALTFACIVAPRALQRLPQPTLLALDHRLLRLVQLSLAAAAAASLVWLVLQAANMASAEDIGAALSAVPLVAGHTSFGRLVLLQLAALLVAALMLVRKPGRWRLRGALAASTLALLLQAGHSHAASMQSGPMLAGSSLLLAADAVHLLAAGAWLGGLLPLLLVVRRAPPREAAMAARWFSPLGKLCIVALVVTSAYQGWVLSGSLAAIVGTAYGWMLLIKLALLGVLFAFACANRYRLAPALLGAAPEVARRILGRSIAVQTGFGLAIIAAAGLLSSLEPGMHSQPIWPFADRFSLDTVSEDPDFAREALAAALALAGSLVLIAFALLLRGPWRRWPRLVAAAAAIVVAWFAVPHLDLLFVPAYPTSFFHSPTEFAAASIAEGAVLFPTHCAVCHGAEGRGNGPAAASLPIPPANLTAEHLWMHSDGELYWWLAHGIPAPDGGPAMPGFADTLSDDQRWALIDYVRAHNAGLVVRQAGDWTPALQAPELQADCAEGPRTLAELRGGFVRVLIGAASAPPLPGVTTILAVPTATPAAGLCVAHDPSVAAAYAVVSGRPMTDPPPTQILIDAHGWLRAAEPVDTVATPQLTAELQRFATHPVSTAAPKMMDMDMAPGMSMEPPPAADHARSKI